MALHSILTKKAYTLLFYTILKVGHYIMSPAEWIRQAKWIKTAGTSTNVFAFHKFGLNVCVYTWFHSAAPVRFGPGGTDSPDGSISTVTYKVIAIIVDLR